MYDYSLFESILKAKNLKPADVSKATGIRATVFSEWKKGKSVPKVDKLMLIADFLDVSIDYLLTGKDKEGKDMPVYYLDEEAAKIAQDLYERPEHKVLFKAVQNVSPEDLKFVQEMVDRLVGKDEK